MRLFILLGVLLNIFACSNSSTYIEQTQQLNTNHLPKANRNIEILNLGDCTDSKDRSIKFNSNQPITVLVHGCNGSAGRFRSLAELYAFHGQQAICFSYDDRDSLIESADKLVTAVQKLAKVTDNKNISIIGHSMGGLIARKAMEDNTFNDWDNHDVEINLITVSAPLAGIKAANTCGYNTLNWLSMGIVPGICWGITGDNWYEITSHSSFIKYPEPLSPIVQRYLKVVTNEENTCRKIDNKGRCIQSDDIFGLSEQYHPTIDSYSKLTNIQVDAGHVEIVGYKDVAPYKLIDILQKEKMLSATPFERQSLLALLLTKLY